MTKSGLPSTSALPLTSVLTEGLPNMPTHVRYMDEYDDSVKTIRDPEGSDVWTLMFDATRRAIDLTLFDESDVRMFVKCLLIWELREYSPHTVYNHWAAIKSAYTAIGAEWFRKKVSLTPVDWGQYWDLEVRPVVSDNEASLIKSLLHFMCSMNFAGWCPDHRDYVRSLSFAWRKSFKGVLSGASILCADEEAAIIAYLDYTSEFSQSDKELSNSELLRFCLLCICYSEGLRPVQIARIAFEDLRCFLGSDGKPVVHIVVHRAKKRHGSGRIAFVRKIKREWAGPFAEYHARRSAKLAQEDRLSATGVKAFPQRLADIARIVGDTVEAITGVRRTATDLRHSAAQRLADAGASVEEIAHFLGHSHWDTSLVYFEASDIQAEQINKALAISPVYSEIAKVARTRTIDKARLLALAPDNQIGALPHGIPISGIGACGKGQSLCALNPVLSCYNCRRFMPVDDVELHRQVLGDLRPIVRHFHDESRGDAQSPAFLQLRTTLAGIQKVVTDIESGNTDAERATCNE